MCPGLPAWHRAAHRPLPPSSPLCTSRLLLRLLCRPPLLLLPLPRSSGVTLEPHGRPCLCRCHLGLWMLLISAQTFGSQSSGRPWVAACILESLQWVLEPREEPGTPRGQRAWRSVPTQAGLGTAGVVLLFVTAAMAHVPSQRAPAASGPWKFPAVGRTQRPRRPRRCGSVMERRGRVDELQRPTARPGFFLASPQPQPSLRCAQRECGRLIFLAEARRSKRKLTLAREGLRQALGRSGTGVRAAVPTRAHAAGFGMSSVSRPLTSHRTPLRGPRGHTAGTGVENLQEWRGWLPSARGRGPWCPGGGHGCFSASAGHCPSPARMGLDTEQTLNPRWTAAWPGSRADLSLW